MTNKFLIVISGPTASGKTKLSLNMAKDFLKMGRKTLIINFDSLLFYKELNIGTAKPSPEELFQIEHSLINIHSIKNPINSFEFVTMARQEIARAHNQNMIAILVGGSAFYLRALFTEMYESITPSPSVSKRIEEILENKGPPGLLEILKEKDPESFNSIHKNDLYRIQRAIEFYFSTGQPISQQRKKVDDAYTLNIVGSNFFHIYLLPPKDIHLQIIKIRIEKMLQSGLIDEVKSILSQGFTGRERPLKAIGYQEVILYLNGEISSIENLQEHIFIKTRQLAKSQKTFFKKIVPKVTYDPLSEEEKILRDIKLFLNQ